MVFLCIDVGGTNTLFGLGNGDFEEVRRVKTKDFLDDVEGTVESVLGGKSVSEVEDVAVAVAGPVDVERGLFYPPNIDKDVVRIREKLGKFGSVSIVNDCAAAVLGEYHYGESAESLLYVTISSGIGAAYIEDGRLVEGFDGNFGEVGHMKVGDSLECGCGGIGHWEAYCSGDNIPKMAEKLHNLKLDHPKDIFELETEKARKSRQEFNEKMRTGFVNLINMYNPEKIIFGGAVALNHFETIQEGLKAVEDEAVNDIPEMCLCGLGDNAVLHGLRATCNNLN